MNNCIIGKSKYVKRSSFTNSSRYLVRFLGKTMWILYINGTEIKKLTSDLCSDEESMWQRNLRGQDKTTSILFSLKQPLFSPSCHKTEFLPNSESYFGSSNPLHSSDWKIYVMLNPSPTSCFWKEINVILVMS